MRIIHLGKQVWATPILLSTLLLGGCQADPMLQGDRTNPDTAPTSVKQHAKGIVWPAGQALPTFAAPARKLDTIRVQSLSPDEQITFSALQGIVNKAQPRIMLLDSHTDEGELTWAEWAELDLGRTYDEQDRYELVAKYADELTGVVLYDPSTSVHYRNLAGTVAGIEGAIPVTPEVYAGLRNHGIELPVAVDLTRLKFTEPAELYAYLYRQYWPKAEHRVILSARPTDDGDLHHTRDLVAAVGGAVVWLDPREPEEDRVLARFFADMEAGNAVALGWYTTERSGISAASKHGIGTIPSDYFLNATVFAGINQAVRIPPVPPMPELENKAYIAIYISDGDNIQYVQRAMRKIWDQARDVRGKVALNWTIAPGLVDVAPVMMNYYYTQATPADAFVTGPSGMGYLIPYNTLNEEGGVVGPVLRNQQRMNSYAELTERYLQRSGLRVVTIWDQASPMHRAAYARHCPSLYGLTVQNFRDSPDVAPSVENGRLYFEKLQIPYAGTYNHVNESITERLDAWDRRSPLFLAYQMSVWHNMKPDRILELYRELLERYPGEVEFIRADHYFNMYNRANGLPFNLSMLAQTKVTSANGAADAKRVIDGTPRTIWQAEGEADQWLVFDFGQPFEVSRCVVRHAGQAGMDPSLNTRAFRVLLSEDGEHWSVADALSDNEADLSDLKFDPASARYLRLEITDPGADGTARIADVEVFGRQP